MISIITATYNAAAHLRHCVASLDAQTVPCEHIIVDGASKDGTLSIIEEYVTQRGQVSPHSLAPRFISAPDQGLYDALNKGIRMATGDIIGILHADDFYLSPDILAKVARVFENPTVEACYGDLLYVRDTNNQNREMRSAIKQNIPSEGIDGSRLSFRDSFYSRFDIVRYWQSGPFSPEKFKWGWMPPHPTFFVRRSVYEKHGLFNLNLGTAADYELMLRFLLKHHVRCAYLPEVLVCMRVGGASNRSLEARLKANRMDRQAWTVNGLRPYPWTIPLKPLRKISQWWKRP